MLPAIIRQFKIKAWQQIVLFLAIFYFVIIHLRPAVQTRYGPLKQQQQYLIPEILDATRHPPLYQYSADLTTNLIIASTAKDNISWTSQLIPHLPQLKIYRYISDSTTAEFRTPVPNKGREALMYLTFMRDFHDFSRTTHFERDGLADVNIFIHAEELPWHGDPALLKSMLFTLSQLDLNQVLESGYVNLRTSWAGPVEKSCPNGGFNTSKTFQESPNGEEYWMKAAFETNFPGEDLPEIFAGPCCSQFAVSRDALQWRDRNIYEGAVDWLVETNWPDQLVGRVWEHMWPWLFKGVAKDCGVEEWRTLCLRFGVCFEGNSALKEFQILWGEREYLEENELGFWRELLRPGKVRWVQNKVEAIGGRVEALLVNAVTRGKDPAIRIAAGK